jgi:hypothetical protein
MNKLDYTVLGAIITATVIGSAIFVVSGMEKQSVDAAGPTGCPACAKDFAPGQEAEDPTSAEDFAPGHCIGCDPKADAPGQFDKKPIPQ